MQVRATGGTLMLVGALFAAGATFAPGAANAARTTPSVNGDAAPDTAPTAGVSRDGRVALYPVHRRAGSSLAVPASRASFQSSTRGRGRRLQCVPFARENSGIELIGDARTWWGKAGGLYERGTRPEVGSVLTFRATRHMPLGHVAVVTKIVDARTIEIDHANWTSAGLITREVSVVDVSERNDWGAVRVELAQSGDYGAIYPVHGFIYDRPDRGIMVANTSFAAAPALPPATRDHRPVQERRGQDAQPYEEVAEAVDDAAPRARRRTVHTPRTRAAGPARSVTGPIYLTLEPAAVTLTPRAARPADR